MKKQSQLLPVRYVPKLPAGLAYGALLAIALLLFLGRTEAALRLKPLLRLAPDFYQHVSNFSISCLLYGGIGFLWLLLGLRFRYVLLLGAVLLLANFICERWIPVLNTPDLVDAYYVRPASCWRFRSCCPCTCAASDRPKPAMKPEPPADPGMNRPLYF